MKLTIHRLAYAEIADAYQFYDENPDRFRTEILRMIARILKSPASFPRCGGLIHKAVLRKFPYTVYYRRAPGEVRILALAHHKRRPEYWSQRI